MNTDKLRVDGHSVKRADGSTFCICDTPKVAQEIVRQYQEHSALNAVSEAANALLDSLAIADKQWIGLNMMNKGQKRAHDIITDGKIAFEKARAALATLRSKEGSK